MHLEATSGLVYHHNVALPANSQPTSLEENRRVYFPHLPTQPGEGHMLPGYVLHSSLDHAEEPRDGSQAHAGASGQNPPVDEHSPRSISYEKGFSTKYSGVRAKTMPFLKALACDNFLACCINQVQVLKT
jgi:hypothetical protein